LQLIAYALPKSRIAAITDRELSDLIVDSELTDKYNKDIYRKKCRGNTSKQTENANKKEVKKPAVNEKAMASTPTSSRIGSHQNPIIDVLNRASFIKSVTEI
jgi:hypothetical protein